MAKTANLSLTSPQGYCDQYITIIDHFIGFPVGIMSVVLISHAVKSGK